MKPVDEFISADDLRYSEQARGLVRIDREAMARAGDGSLDRYVPRDGKPMRRELMNLLRYDSRGRLAEEWVQYGDLTFLTPSNVEPNVPPPSKPCCACHR